MNSMAGTAPMEARRTAEKLVRYRKDFRLFAKEQLKIKGQPLEFWPCQLPLLEILAKRNQEQS